MNLTAHKYWIFALAVSGLGLWSPPPLQANPYRQGKAYYSRGNYNKAREYFQKSMKSNPGNGSAFYYMAVLLERDGKKAQAMQHYRKAVAGTMEADIRDKAYWKLVLYYRYHRDWDNLAVYSARFLRYRKSAKIQGFLAEAERNRDPTAAAIAKHMRQAETKRDANDNAGAATHYRRVLALRSGYAPARWELALLLMKTRQYSEARRHLKRLAMGNASKWEYQYKLGVSNYHLGDHRAALENFERARELNKKPDKSFRYYLGLGEGLAYLGEGRYAKARESLRASAASRKSATVLAAQGRSAFWLGKMDEADRYARQVLDKKADLPDGLLTLGLVQNFRGQKRLALGTLKKMDASLARDKQKPKKYFSSGYLVLGTLASRAKDPKLSLAALDRVDRAYLRKRDLGYLSPKKTAAFQADPVYDYYYGKGLLETGRPRESLTYLKRLKPTLAVRYLMARAHAEQDDTRGTRRELETIFAHKPEFRAKALADPAFRRLAEKDTDFMLFLENREPAKPDAPGGATTTTKPDGPADPNAPAKLPPLDLD